MDIKEKQSIFVDDKENVQMYALLGENMDKNIEQTARPLTVEDAASFLGYTKSYLYRLVHEKRIPYYKPGGCRGARVYFKQADLEAFAFRGRCSADFELAEQAEQILTSSKKRK